jgi:hypothetical protein
LAGRFICTVSLSDHTQHLKLNRITASNFPVDCLFDVCLIMLSLYAVSGTDREVAFCSLAWISAGGGGPKIASLDGRDTPSQIL